MWLDCIVFLQPIICNRLDLWDSMKLKGIDLSGEREKTLRQFAPNQLDFKRRDALSEGGAATLRASPFLLE